MNGRPDPVDAALRRRPRIDFLPPEVRVHAGVDAPLPIGHGQTNSQPSTVANMLRLLEVEPGQRVLDVGSGSGWTVALLGELVGEGGSVLGVEIVPELTQRAQEVLRLQDMPWVELRQALPGVMGVPEDGPYDRILVSAEAGELPGGLVDQLKEGGSMVIPVAGTMLRVEKVAGRPRITRHGLYRFVPLISP